MARVVGSAVRSLGRNSRTTGPMPPGSYKPGQHPHRPHPHFPVYSARRASPTLNPAPELSISTLPAGVCNRSENSFAISIVIRPLAAVQVPSAARTHDGSRRHNRTRDRDPQKVDRTR